jgi:hypothetical protein
MPGGWVTEWYDPDPDGPRAPGGSPVHVWAICAPNGALLPDAPED